MAFVNEEFLKLPGSYLFADIAKRVNNYKASHPNETVISLGIGDVTRPLPQAVCEAMHKAVDEMAQASTFRGYGPDQGYPFLLNAIVENDYKARGINIGVDEVFVNDGAKSDSGNIGDILSYSNKIGITDPVYPVYVDSNVMGGRAGQLIDGKWTDIVYIPCNEENDFTPQIPETKTDIVYLCYPNNPTGASITKEVLKKWVDYALEKNVLILYDAAYKAYIQDAEIPHSIYEVENAKKVAIEFRSFSKTAGFTGTRCGYTVVPKELNGFKLNGEAVSLHKLWSRRQSTKFNGTSYITQRGAEAVYSPEGKKQVKETVQYYMDNAKMMKEGLLSTGLRVYGGDNAPYIWVKTPDGIDSWTFFDNILNNAKVVTTPGVGFGPSGQGFIRLTAFGTTENSKEAIDRIKKWL
jgi:LL-diaminopimelate aminotransferase